MKLTDLMEKAEAGQFTVLTFLLQQESSSVKEVMEETGFSKATLLKYVSLINDLALENQLSLSVAYVEDNLSLTLSTGTKSREIRRLFLQNAIKYQLLCHLLYKHKFMGYQLAQELMISEATLNRHLAGLNHILSEFEISIQNGKLRGPEHQIRYFYFCLFRKVWSGEEWAVELGKPERIRELKVLEELCGASFTKGQALDLCLWCHISQHRLRIKACQFQELESLMTPYFQLIFYQRLLRVSASLFAGQYIPFGSEDNEIMLLFSFLFSQRILPLHTVEYILGFGGPIADLTTKLIQEMRSQDLVSDYMDGQVTYELSQLCAQTYIFRGYLLQDDYKYNVNVRLPYLFSDQHDLSIAMQLIQDIPVFHQETTLDRKILWELLQLLDYIAENKGKKISIGLDIAGGPLVFHRIMSTLRHYLEYNQFIHLESYQREKSYDLLISNHPICEAYQQTIYYLKNDCDMKDLASIRQLIYDNSIYNY